MKHYFTFLLFFLVFLSGLKAISAEPKGGFDLKLIPENGILECHKDQWCGFGYSITNQSSKYYLWLVDITSDRNSSKQTDDFLFQANASISGFDWPAVAPGESHSQNYTRNINLVSFHIPADSQNITVEGNWVVTMYWYDKNPFEGGKYIGSPIEYKLPFKVHVSP